MRVFSRHGWCSLKLLCLHRVSFLCYTRSMRNWMRERMKRRKKKPENESEATGKVGQQKPPIDAGHPEPIVPTYDEVPSGPPQSVVEAPPAAEERRMETEVQPESPTTPPPGPPEQKPATPASRASNRPPKGVVVLAIEIGRAHV